MLVCQYAQKFTLKDESCCIYIDGFLMRMKQQQIFDAKKNPSAKRDESIQFFIIVSSLSECRTDNNLRCGVKGPSYSSFKLLVSAFLPPLSHALLSKAFMLLMQFQKGIDWSDTSLASHTYLIMQATSSLTTRKARGE